MTATTWRKNNFKKICERYPTLAAMSQVTGLSERYLSQMKNGSRNIGNSTARKLEESCGLVEGELDLPPSDADALIRKAMAELDESAVIAAVEDAIRNVSPEARDTLAKYFLELVLTDRKEK